MVLCYVLTGLKLTRTYVHTYFRVYMGDPSPRFRGQLVLDDSRIFDAYAVHFQGKCYDVLDDESRFYDTYA